MNELILILIGNIVMVLFSLLVISGLVYVIYGIYDYWIKKLLGWKSIELRKDLLYFIKHKDEIRNYIKKEKRGK
ncbi:MAG: hypothetical protein ACOCRK_11210 [bacterium]